MSGEVEGKVLRRMIRFRAALLATVTMLATVRAMEEHPLLPPPGAWSQIFPDLQEVHAEPAEGPVPSTGTLQASGGQFVYASAQLDASGSLRATTT